MVLKNQPTKFGIIANVPPDMFRMIDSNVEPLFTGGFLFRFSKGFVTI